MVPTPPRRRSAPALVLGLWAAVLLAPHIGQAAPGGERTTTVRPRVTPARTAAQNKRPGWFARTRARLTLRKVKPTGQALKPKNTAAHTGTDLAAGLRPGSKPKPPRTGTTTKVPGNKNKTLGLREAFNRAREELQVYRGPALERIADRLAMGPSDFDPKRSVRENLKDLVEKHNIPHYYAEVNGRRVLHLVVDLAQGKATRENVRRVLKRVGDQTIELNYKAASSKNPYGHVAVRVGGGPLYDLTGTQGVTRLPPLAESALRLVRGSGNLKFARRRSLRRFMESRRDSPNASASVYYGMLFAASPDQIKATRSVYDRRLKEVKAFNVNGGNGDQGVYSCAQFLTEKVPFINEAGISRDIGAKSTAAAARRSDKLEAVVVYKMPGVSQEQLAAGFP